jgi:hypothetical protein
MPKDPKPPVSEDSNKKPPVSVSTGGATVTIACKLPAGLLLRLFDMKEHKEPLMGGGYHAVKRSEPIPGAEFLVLGNAYSQRGQPRGEIVGGYALTPDCPREFWDKWLAQNKDSAMVKNHLIFAHEVGRDTRAEARDKKDVVSNLERLDPNKLPKGVEKSELMKAA